MAYENHLPPLSNIDQGTRDFDFIPLTELREFDEKLNEIIKKISTMNTSENADVNSMAYKLKEIEYNLADAIEFDENGNVVGLKSTTSDKFEDGSGNTIVPDQGPASYDNLISDLEKYYNEFVKYLGNDVESDQWKIDLQKIFIKLKTSLDNKIASIFGNSAQASILEEKENDKTDFMKLDSVKLNSNEIMRLNPNVSNYTRNINLMFEKPGEELIAFEVECPEPDNMIFNMKLQNGDMYYNYNVILDNGKLHITKEEHFKLSKYGIKLNVYKYITASKIWRYVFTLSSDSEDISKVYNFELSGVFVGRFIFDTNAAFPSDHGNYWAFHAVDTTGKVDPTKTYYEKRIDDYNDERNQETNIIYQVVDKEATPTPIPGEVYYVKTVDETDTVVYREYKELTEFDPELTYFTKYSETTTDESDKVIIYVEVNDLKEFKPGVEYFTKETEFIYVDSIQIDKEYYSDGEVDDITVDHKGERLIEENFKKVVGSKKYTNKTIKVMNIDVESSELLSNKKYEEKIANVANKNIVHLDDSIKFTKTSTPGLLVKSRDGARKINNSLNIGFGAKVVELKTIRPHSYEVINTPCIKKEDITSTEIVFENKTDNDFEYELGTITIAGHTIEFFSSEINIKDMYENKLLPDAIKFDGITLLNFKDIMQNVSNFISKAKIVAIGCVGTSMFDFMVVCDDIEDYDTCYHIYINLKEEEIAIPIMRKVLNDGNEQNIPFDLQSNVTQLIGNTEKTYLFTEDSNCYESLNGILWTKKNFVFDKRFYTELDSDKLKVLGLVKNEYYGDLYAIIIDANIEDETKIPLRKILYAKLDSASDYLAFDDCSETMIKGWTQKYNGLEVPSSAYIVNNSYFGIIFNKDVMRIYVLSEEFGNPNSIMYLDYNIRNKECLRCDAFYAITLERNKNNKFNGVTIIDEESNNIYIFGSYSTSSNSYSYIICNLETLALVNIGGNSNYTIHPAYFKKSTSLLNVDKRFKAIACKNDRLDGGSENPYEGYFIYIDTEEPGAYYTLDESSTELTPISIFDGVRVYNVSYCGDVNNKITFAFTSNGLYVNLTTDPTQFTLVNVDLVFDEHSSANFANNTDLANFIWVISGQNGVMYTHDGITFDVCEKYGLDSLRNIGDIDGDYLIGKTSLDSVINDVNDGVFVRNIYDKNRKFYYKKVGDYKFGYGNGNNQTCIIDWVSGDKKTYDLPITNIFDIDGEIYAYFNREDSVSIYKFINEEIGFEEITDSIESRFKNPINISDIKQDIEGNIFVIGTEISGNKGVIYYGETFETLKDVLTLSEDGVIDCFFIYDNEIIISTYEPYAETRHYAWDDEAKSFKYEDLNNINLIYSFRRCFTYNGELYVMNGSGSNPHIVEKGFAKIKRIISNTERNGFYDIDVITPISDDFQIKHDNYLFSYASTLFGIFTTSEYDENNVLVSKKFHIYVYYPAAARFIEVNEQIAPLLVAVVNMGNRELEECIANRAVADNYTVAIQESYDESKKPIRNYEPEDENENYQTDKIYFDKENSGIVIGNYASETNRFNMKARMAAIGVTGKTHKSQLAMVLGQDNLLGVYDKTLNVIKTFKLKYDVVVENGLVKRIDVDDRFIAQNIFVASDDDSNYAFISLRGYFPVTVLGDDGTTISESPSSTISYGLFKVNLDDVFSGENDYALMSMESFTIDENTSTKAIVDHITSTYGYSVAKDMILNVFNNRQLIGIVKGFMYENIESIVFWNTDSMCLDILSPLDWNVNIDDIDAQYNRNNAYKDYNIAIDNVNGEAFQTYIDDDNTIVKNKVSFTSIPNELVRVGSKTYIADDFLKSVKDVTFKDTHERAESAEINLEAARLEYENKLSVLNTAQNEETTALNEFNAANDEYQTLLTELEQLLSNSNSAELIELNKTLGEKITARVAAETALNDATNILNNTAVDAENYNELLANKEAAQEAYDVALEEERIAQEAYDAELNNSNSEEIASKNADIEASKRRYQIKLTAYNNARNNVSTANINLEKALKAYETAQFIYDSMKSKSMIDVVTFDDGLVGKIDPNVSIDRLTHTRFGALAWDSLVKSNLNPNSHNDLHYIVKKSGNIVLDTFTGNGIRYYNKALNTRVGLFRWYDYVSADEVGAVEGTNNRPAQYNVNSDEYNTGWMYFTPTGGGKVITINPGAGRYIYRMWDTPYGVFMSVRNYRYYGLSAVEYWSFKQLIAIPTDDSKSISIDDYRYFADLNCNEVKILDCCNTQEGLFITGHSNNKYVTLRYNGDDFYIINNNEAKITSIIDTVRGTMFFTDEDNGDVYEFDETTETLKVSTVFNPKIGNLQIASKFGQRRTDVETPYGPQIVAKGGVYNFLYNDKVVFSNTSGNGPASLQKIRIYVNNENDNLPVIAEHLAARGLPMDVDIKCVGSIMYNGLQVLINGLQLISENGLSRKPLTVKFYIDKNARFTRNRESIEALFGKNSDKWTEDRDIGVISDYDPKTGNYFDIPCQISKMNFIVLIEEFNNYDTGEERFIVKKIIEYKTEIYETEDDNIDGYVVPSGWKLRDSELIEEKKLKDYKWVTGDDEGINIEYNIGNTTNMPNATNVDNRLISNSSDSVSDNLNKSVIYSVIKSIKDGYKYDFTNNDNVKFTPLANKSKINTDEFLYMKADNVNINDNNHLRTQKITIRTLQPNKIISSSYDYSFKKSKIKILPIDVFNDNQYHISSNEYFKLSDIVSDIDDQYIIDNNVPSYINIHDGDNVKKSNLVGLGLNWSNLFKQIIPNQYDFLFNLYYVYDTGIVIECEMVFCSSFYGYGGIIRTGGIFCQDGTTGNKSNELFYTNLRIDGDKRKILFPLLNTIGDIKNQYNLNTNTMNSINTKGPEGLHIPIYNGIGYANSVNGETVPISDLKTLKIPRVILHYYSPGVSWNQSVLETLISRYDSTNSGIMNDFINKLKDLQYSYLSINSDIYLVDAGTASSAMLQKRINLHTEFDFSNAGDAIFSDKWEKSYTMYDTITGIRVWKIDDYNEFKNTLSKETYKKVNY